MADQRGPEEVKARELAKDWIREGGRKGGGKDEF